ncbi:hypothetical protein E6W36_04425 [Hankyongella ginsenosidimutans]|uniref:Uncharacterized protein n=1 Tax=Hankyongella ginsenosidimutans TaxID=1763828 RepID=A0A4D7C063_9SPHN|nr:hypothetical protein [Hankyongella ginsenosidimutans]QCI79094.1 hypothetical protein E6W36_04425 [Hankyongella ginsenosidimutans]
MIGLLGLLAFFLILRPMMKRSRLEAAAVAGDGTGLSLEGQEERLALAPPDRGHVIAELIDRAADGDDEAIRQIQAAREANAGACPSRPKSPSRRSRASSSPPQSRKSRKSSIAIHSSPRRSFASGCIPDP